MVRASTGSPGAADPIERHRLVLVQTNERRSAVLIQRNLESGEEIEREFHTRSFLVIRFDP
jgi:hypothetical protein